MALPSLKGVEEALNQIGSSIHRTPIVTSDRLNQWFGHRLYFKAECLQKVGAFKARGALNALMQLKKQSSDDVKVITNSSGNHAQALAWAGQKLNIPVTVYMPKSVSSIKRRATESYGANVIVLEDRKAVDVAVEQAASESGNTWIPPYNHIDVIQGQGTAMLEALDQLPNIAIDAVFAPCGGGGLLSGTIAAAKKGRGAIQVFGVEPELGDDAAQSLQSGEIRALDASPNTLADGARTLSLGDITFECLKSLAGFYTASEVSIVYWTQWLRHLLKLTIEPTSAMTMAGVTRWLATQDEPQDVLVILSGGNIDVETNRKLYQYDFLDLEPSIDRLDEINRAVHKKIPMAGLENHSEMAQYASDIGGHEITIKR